MKNIKSIFYDIYNVFARTAYISLTIDQRNLIDTMIVLDAKIGPGKMIKDVRSYRESMALSIDKLEPQREYIEMQARLNNIDPTSPSALFPMLDRSSPSRS